MVTRMVKVGLLMMVSAMAGAAVAVAVLQGGVAELELAKPAPQPVFMIWRAGS